ncbi:glycoside hydrolase family 13 protein [Hydrogenoanaerobacterium sp.]|uniref:glycoside hydrolase family 13 protein n=1 Tax=Hydrogenoanaerobacterium sp. TaxID=2953763 RepID=UPI00289E9FB9|nr:glycoside hydrolase family 13 protein [Hydrogenoanaerobacterium sp.]
MSFIFYDSHSTQFKKPFGALGTGEQAEFRLHLPKNGEFTNPRMLLYKADAWDTPQVIEMSFIKAELTCNVFSCKLSLPLPQLYFYCFEAEQNGSCKKLSRTAGNTGAFTDSPPQLWQLTVYNSGFETPDFLKGGIMYQIFPDRFFCSGKPKHSVPPDRKLHQNWYEMPDYLPDEDGKITNTDYFCGDLQGIISKMDYLHSMHISCIYLNPVFEAHSSHRYNTADYRRIDCLLGDENDLRELCAKGRELGIRVVLDGVFSHTGDDSLYFNRKNRYPTQGAYNSKDSRYYHWYDFSQWPDKYSSWWGFDTLPNVDETNDDYIEFICGEGGVLHYWLSLGVSGYRLDVADELPDKFLDALTASVKAYDPQAVIIGEVWEDASNKVAYGVRKRYFGGAQLDSVMNYPFKDAILSFIRYGGGGELNNTVLSILENYPKPVVDVLMNSLSTHDVERAITKLAGEPLDDHDRPWQMRHHFLSEGDYQRGRQLFMLAQVLQFFLPGVPCLYYGDEVGMTGYRDPFNRCTYPWESGDSELLEFTKTLCALRREYSALLADAPFVPTIFDNDVYAFTRMRNGEGLLVVVNRGDGSRRLTLPFEPEVLAGNFSDGILAAQSFIIGKI